MPAQQQQQQQSTINISGGGFTFPAALLAQYPALLGLQWDQLGGGTGHNGDEGDGRSNYDASSQGGDFDDEDGYASGSGGGGGLGSGGGAWACDYEGR